MYLFGSMSASRARRTAPKGEQTLTTPEWKRDVQARLDELGRTRSWLAAELGTTRSAVTKMLDPARYTSSLVRDVCRILSISPPTEEVSQQEQHALRLLRSFTPELRATALAQLEVLSKLSGKE